ncbi:adenylyl-sulfate kinase [Buchnera aphidicola (Aphis helianthi)]|uniref:Adenylyl-sulfate kinase n=1 Tax=Buchnera aphidicola (Aphis helianthi) TaxID=2315802 RepID=A0A4D6XUC1_9GAMM|nr:adenylyl-sulfate kinase [Buchnera aphidicola]QCI17231.1 adenylyl-sulfate kinase [Buchnera aphidicola (Aphis helianthi)]
MNNKFKKNIVFQKYEINRIKRENKNGYKSKVIWFTGLSGSGKSTISNILEKILFKNDINTYVLDGDNIRSGLCSDLTFSSIDRNENIRRIAEVAKIMLNAGIMVLVCTISPYKKQRLLAYNILGKSNILEVFVDTPLTICEQRDPKGLYKKSRSNEILNFTGIDSLYELPEKPDIYLNGTVSITENIKTLIKTLYKNNIIFFSTYS